MLSSTNFREYGVDITQIYIYKDTTGLLTWRPDIVMSKQGFVILFPRQYNHRKAHNLNISIVHAFKEVLVMNMFASKEIMVKNMFDTVQMAF